MKTEPSDVLPAARRIGRILIGGVWIGLALAAAWLVRETVLAWRPWKVYSAQTGIAIRVLEDPINADDPLLGWKHVPGRSVPMPILGGDVVWTINSNGFRGDRDVTPTVPPGKHRVIALGDSFTFGNVRADETWPALLEARLSASEVVNMGASAYGVDQMYLWYREDGAKLAADVVVLAVIGDDMRRATLDRWVSGHGRPLFRWTGNALVLTNVPVPPRIPPGKPLTGSWGFVRFLATRLVHREAPPADPTVPIHVVEALARLVREKGGRFLVVFLPLRQGDPDGWADRLREAARAGGWAFTDLESAFLARQEKGARTLAGTWFRPDGHYNVAGNAVVADEVARQIVSLGWWPPPEAAGERAARPLN